MVRNHRTQLRWFIGVVAVVFVLAIWATVDLPWRARIFPQTVAAIGLVITLWTWIVAGRTAINEEGKGVPTDEAIDDRPTHTWRHLGWAAGYLAGIALVGFTAGSAVWLSLFLRREDSMPWRFSIAAGAAVVVVLLTLARIARMPGGWLFG